MKTAVYTHKITKQTYFLRSDSMDLEKAWKCLKAACLRMNWNYADAEMGNIKVEVK